VQKTISRRKALSAMMAGGLALGMPKTWAAAAYPSQNVTMIVPFGAGGGSDILCRTIAAVIQDLKLLPVEFLIENRPGSSGARGYKLVADRRGDPYVMAPVGASFFSTPLLGASPVGPKDFTPIAAIAMSPYIVVVRPESKIKSLADMAAAKRLSTGTVGVVSDAGLLGPMISKALKVQVVVVPFEGEGEIKAGVLGGHLDFMLANPSEVMAQIQAGAMRPIAVASTERMKILPDVPTFLEEGYDIEYSLLRSIAMPQGMSDEVIAYWEDIFRKVATSEEWKTRYLDRYKDEAHFVGHKDLALVFERVNNRYATIMTELGIIKK